MQSSDESALYEPERGLERLCRINKDSALAHAGKRSRQHSNKERELAGMEIKRSHEHIKKRKGVSWDGKRSHEHIKKERELAGMEIKRSHEHIKKRKGVSWDGN